MSASVKTISSHILSRRGGETVQLNPKNCQQKKRSVAATVVAFTGLLAAILPDGAVASTFGGYDCSVDCSGHKAGYEWAEVKGITDESECEDILLISPNRTSFYEGCMAYVEDPSRGADQDDDGDDIDE